ncbi:MAG: DUF1924 domain-containing protein [Gammaproteobacteria bacterium]|nr:DUF1924 domain-containing protein [Gammaproteobacteria bacterium]
MKLKTHVGILFITLVISAGAHAAVVDDVIKDYIAQGANNVSAARGEQMWSQQHQSSEDGKMRSCTSCHSKDLRTAGKHVKTGKTIDPLAPSANRERLTDVAKIEKWFRRNCKWTMGRECTVQEKADFLSYIRTQ